MYRSKILAIDFDGTIAEAAFPGLGKIKPGAADFIIIKIKKNGKYNSNNSKNKRIFRLC